MTTAVSAPRAARPAKRTSYWARYRHSLWLLTTRDLKVRYTTSRLGYLWSIIDPLLMALIYWAIFGFVFPRRADLAHEPYIIFLLCAVLPWTWFNGNLSDATRAFRQEGKLIRSVKIPRSIWILRQIASKGIEFLISLSIIVVFALCYLKAPSPMLVVYLPVAIALQVLLTVGCNFIIAPLSVFYRDLERVVKLGLRVLFYGAPVLYHPSIGNPVLHFLYGLNPLAGILDLYRGCFFPDIVDWVYVAEGTVVSVILFTIGAVVFRRSVPRVLKEL
ncbi:ABC transporter permease [Amnibacterium kyonggiense]|uniref:Transport permease protein n=1 Tax=Amnibacterium kyonggiense TaxID=595671 RepID=A0A4R7FG80_9MICO|nr:ABC transporter permease [Amnibacterium kyonggiense]TDS75940.1 ABC-2 type transport system permease protein [Amnibacterium kyonggiense]